jgi:hypothetical protein
LSQYIFVQKLYIFTPCQPVLHFFSCLLYVPFLYVFYPSAVHFLLFFQSSFLLFSFFVFSPIVSSSFVSSPFHHLPAPNDTAVTFPGFPGEKGRLYFPIHFSPYNVENNEYLQLACTSAWTPDGSTFPG